MSSLAFQLFSLFSALSLFNSFILFQYADKKVADKKVSNQAYQRTLEQYRDFDVEQTREKSQAIASYYVHSAIEATGALNSVRLTPRY